MTIEAMITEMQAVKAEHPTLEIPDILRIFNIQVMRNLTKEIHQARFKR